MIHNKNQIEFIRRCAQSRKARQQIQPFIYQLQDILHKGRSTAYKYTRGEIILTYEDALKMSRHFEVSLDPPETDIAQAI